MESKKNDRTVEARNCGCAVFWVGAQAGLPVQLGRQRTLAWGSLVWSIEDGVTLAQA